ncbi:hypothetical protein PUNSTDRAFT_49426, partial [Punctularia strigosozonata HHB-11173 SS5]|uniref:uncharacterized protein n=1 Tax=Punctularia strigosozonata (strain HHB-11173) TaxID=741275 RepID=UPI00044168F1
VPLSNAQGYLDRPTSAMQHHDRGLTLPTPPPSAHGPPPPREQQYQQQQQQQSRVRSTSLSQQPYGTANTHRSTSTSRKPPPLIVSSRAPSSRHGANPGRAPAIVYAPSRNNMAMDEAYHPPEVMPRSAPAHQTTFPRGQIPPPQPIPLPGTGLPFPGETDQRHGDVPDTRSGRGRSHSRGRSKSRGRSSNESGVLVDSNGSSVVLVTPPSNHAVLVDSSSPSHHARHVTHHGHSHSYPQNSFGAPSPGRIHRPATSMGQHPAASSGGRSGSLVRALLPRSNSVTRMITGKRSKNRPTEEPQRGQVVHSRDLAAHGYANPRSRNTSTSSGSTYYVLPNPGQKVHVISTDDEASRYASTRSSGSSRYHRGTSSGQHSLLAIPPPQAPPGSPAVQSTKKPFFFNRLFGGMHLRDRSVDSARASSSRPRGERDKWSSGGGMVVTPALPPPQDTVQADASMFAADGRKMVMENPQDQAYGGSAGRSRGRKLLRRTSDQPPPMMHNYPAAT